MSDQQTTSEEQWAAEELAGLALEDERLNRRCQELAVAFSQQTSGPINQACEDWASSKAAYRFFANEKATPERITEAHRRRTVERMKAYPVVLAVQDTSFLDYSHHPQTKGLGEIGNKRQNLRGFGMHTTLAVTPQGMSLGLLTQEFFTRPVGQPSHQRQEMRTLPIEDKESYRWLQALRHTLALAPSGVEVITVADREADIYELFVEAQQPAAQVLIRACIDRCLAEEEVGKLWDKLERQAICAYLDVSVARKGEQEPRQARVSVRFAHVTLKAPWRPKQQKLPAVPLQAILVREVEPPPEVPEPIEWLLLTNVPVSTCEEALQVIGWYCCRWQIEVFHKILKSGCRVEDCRLQTAGRLQAYIALMSIIAWRLHWCTYLNRTQPEAPCTLALTTFEWQALYMRIHRTKQLPATPPTLRQAVRWIAQLGGFLGRKSDGEPGVTVIWRGWQRLQDMADTWYFAANQQT